MTTTRTPAQTTAAPTYHRAPRVTLPGMKRIALALAALVAFAAALALAGPADATRGATPKHPAQSGPLHCRFIDTIGGLASVDSTLDASALFGDVTLRENLCRPRPGLLLYVLRGPHKVLVSYAREFATDRDPIVVCGKRYVALGWDYYARLHKKTRFEKRHWASWSRHYARAHDCQRFAGGAR